MQTTGRIYLTFSQLLNQVEIIDSPSAMIEMENEEVPFFFLFQPPPYHHPPCFFLDKRTIELVTRLEMPCQLSQRGQGAQL